MSQVEFASLLGVSRSHLCDIEKGRKGLSPSRAAVFAQKLGYSEMLFVKLALPDLVTREGLGLHVSVNSSQRQSAASPVSPICQPHRPCPF